MLAKQYKADPADIIIHKLSEGSIIVDTSVGFDNFLLTDRSFGKNEQFNVLPFFNEFNISIDDLDPIRCF